MTNFRILFMGTAPFSIPTLQKIITGGYELKGVYTSPSKKANRGMQISKSPVALYAEENNLELYSPKELRSPEEIKFIKDMNLDFIVVIAYGLILPEEILNLPKFGCYNLHASILPRWRGAAPIQRSMIEGDKMTGVTIMKMNKGLDTGDIVLQDKLKINISESYTELETRLSLMGAELFEKFFKDSLFKNITQKQDDTLSCYAEKISKQETKIFWKEDALKIVRRINAYNPNPGAWFMWKNKRIKILKAIEVDIDAEPGKVVDDNLNIGCGNKSIRPIILKVEGKQSCSIDEFLLGNKISVGSILE
ncbi:methionyl-tRNA formyltransferase [Pelagibacteraceae bacterium]|nr:methionyl-tRNA formyltransferase [Pelagibacteraceae bacterium]